MSSDMSVVRIQRRNGIVVQDCDVYIGRSCTRGGWNLECSKWANPFTVSEHGEKAIALYEKHVRSFSKLYGSLEELEGKRLGCWCAPKPCHGNVLLKLLEERRTIAEKFEEKTVAFVRDNCDALIDVIFLHDVPLSERKIRLLEELDITIVSLLPDATKVRGLGRDIERAMATLPWIANVE